MIMPRLTETGARFRNDCEGLAAVEFALTAPLFGLLIAGIATVAVDIKYRSDVREALRLGAHVIMSGEEDPATVEGVVAHALGNQSEKMTIRIVRDKRCGGVLTIEHICADGNAPQEFMTVHLQSVEEDTLNRSGETRESIEVRVR